MYLLIIDLNSQLLRQNEDNQDLIRCYVCCKTLAFHLWIFGSSIVRRAYIYVLRVLTGKMQQV